MSEETFRRNRNGVLDDFSNVCGALFPADVCFISGYLLSLCIHKYFEEHENYLLLSILCLAGILMSCTQKHTRYRIGVSQCSDDEWRHKMNNEIVREALFYDGVEVEDTYGKRQ